MRVRVIVPTWGGGNAHPDGVLLAGARSWAGVSAQTGPGGTGLAEARGRRADGGRRRCYRPRRVIAVMPLLSSTSSSHAVLVLHSSAVVALVLIVVVLTFRCRLWLRHDLGRRRAVAESKTALKSAYINFRLFCARPPRLLVSRSRQVRRARGRGLSLTSLLYH